MDGLVLRRVPRVLKDGNQMVSGASMGSIPRSQAPDKKSGQSQGPRRTPGQIRKQTFVTKERTSWW